jgi:WD40 repeat protein
LLGIGRNDGTVEIWSLEHDRPLRSGKLQTPGVTAMAFSGNGRSIALAAGPGAVEIWNLRTGQSTRLGRGAPGRIKTLAFTDGGHFLTATVEGRATDWVWDIKAGAELALPTAVTGRFLISPDEKSLAAATTNYSVTLWDLPSLRERTELKGHRWTINAMAFSPDGKALATGGLDAVTRLWDVTSGAELTRPLRGHLQGIESLAFSKDGKTLASASTDHTVKIWHVTTGRELFGLTDASAPVFSQDGNTLMINSREGTRLWHVPSLAEIDAARKDGEPNG